MFNRSVYYAGDNSTNIRVNAVSGGIVKNHADSYFKRFHLRSNMADRLLCERPYRIVEEAYSKKYVYVEVLQLVIVGDMEVIAEVIDIPEETKDVQA